MPEELKPYVNDYKVNVIEVAYLDEETINKFQSDFRLVADYFVQRRKNGNYNPPEQEIKHVEATLACLSAISGDDRLVDAYDQSERRITNMCEMIDKIIERGREEGRAQERSMIDKIVEKGCAEGRFSVLLTNVKNLTESTNWTVDQAMDNLKIPKEEREGIKKQLEGENA